MMGPFGQTLKRGLDVVVSAALLLVGWPVLVVLVVAVRLDSRGPGLFVQQRLGRSARPFSLLKIRTMRLGSDVIVSARGQAEVDGDDPRLTRVGRLLRRTSLDELPQLWNVLRGEMSLVGPRPDLPIALTIYQGEEAQKLAVRPGLTGLAQISGRNALDVHARWALDLRYVREQSLALDAILAARTLGQVLGGVGLYPAPRPPREEP